MKKHQEVLVSNRNPKESSHNNNLEGKHGEMLVGNRYQKKNNNKAVTTITFNESLELEEER